jgi:helicase
MGLSEIGAFGASPALIKALEKTGLKDLYPSQVLALETGLLKERDSFVVAAPTASGKTLIAEMAILQNFFEGGGKALYLVPLRALAREKFDDFTARLRDTGLRVMQSTGDFDSADPWLRQGDLILTTNEKTDSLLRHRAPWLREVRLIIADEIHLLRDPRRGPTLEVVLTRMRSLNPGSRIIALSATIPNAREIAEWLDAKLIESSWRPVPLREGVYYNGTAIFNDGTVRWVPEESSVDVVNLAVETVKEGGQALVFVNTRKSTEAVARSLEKHISPLLSLQEKEILKDLSLQILGSTAEPTAQCRKLSGNVSGGVAFHHAGILSAQRRIIEDGFRRNLIKCLASTTTLAMGLNLPSRRVVIRDWWRYESGLGMQPIPAIEVKQMGGRAGRPRFDEYGEAVLVARDKEDEQTLFKTYIKGELEPIVSQLGNEAALRTHVLSAIAGLFARSRRDLNDFFGGTFFAHQEGRKSLSGVISEIVAFLEREEMVLPEGEQLRPTPFGSRVSELYIDPLTGVILRNALRMEKGKEVFSLLHLIAQTPDMMALSLRTREQDEMLDIFYARKDQFLVPEEELFPTEELLAQIKTASTLERWIEETPEEEIVKHFGIGPGDLRTLLELADWLLYSASEISRVLKLRRVARPISEVRIRIRYGVKEELLDLVSLRGIGRVRARNLYQAGFITRKEIGKATIADLSKVPTVGKTIAEDIKSQVEKGLGKKKK